MGAVLFHRNLTASLFIGACTWEGDGGEVQFQHLERASGFNLNCPSDLSEFPNILVAVVRECEDCE